MPPPGALVIAPTATAPGTAGQSPRRASARDITLVVVGVVVPGFLTMCALATFTESPHGLPGFWDYPSGTIGDGLLLPVLFAVLFVLAQALPRANHQVERRAFRAGLAVGAVGGALVPISWLVGPNTDPIWLLPRPHHFTVAGWVHLIYATVSSALLVALMAITLLRLRHAGRQNWPRSTGPLLVTAAAAGVGMLLLIGRDAVLGGMTVASAATVIGLVALAVLFLGGVRWAVGPVGARRLGRSAGIILVFAGGLTLIIVGWPPHYPVIVIVGATSALLGMAAATTSLAAADRYRWPVVAALGTLLTGGLVRSIDAYVDGGRWPLLWLSATLVLTFIALGAATRSRGHRSAIARHVLFVGYCLLACYFAARVTAPGPGRVNAGAPVAVADTAFDVMIFALIQSRFSTLGENDARNIEAEYLRWHEDPQAFAQRTQSAQDQKEANSALISDMYLLGFAVALSLLTLLAAAAEPLGLNRGTATPAPDRLLGVAAIVAILLTLVVNELLLRRYRRTTMRPQVGPTLEHLALPPWYWIAPAIGAGIWLGTAIALSGGPDHVPGLALGAAVVTCAFTARTLVYSPILLQTLKPTRGQVALALWVALCLGAGAYVFLAGGVWQGSAGLPGWALAVTATGHFVGASLVLVLAGLALSSGLPDGLSQRQTVLSRESVRAYIGLDAAVLGLVFAIGIVVPLYAASRDSSLHVTSLNVIAAMVFLPGLIAAVIWGLRNWSKLAQLTRDAHSVGLPAIVFHQAGGSWVGARVLEERRLHDLQAHLTYLRVCVVALMALGLGHLTVVLLA